MRNTVNEFGIHPLILQLKIRVFFLKHMRNTVIFLTLRDTSTQS